VGKGGFSLALILFKEKVLAGPGFPVSGEKEKGRGGPTFLCYVFPVRGEKGGRCPLSPRRKKRRSKPVSDSLTVAQGEKGVMVDRGKSVPTVVEAQNEKKGGGQVVRLTTGRREEGRAIAAVVEGRKGGRLGRRFSGLLKGKKGKSHLPPLNREKREGGIAKLFLPGACGGGGKKGGGNQRRLLGFR